jgi:ATP-binding cassette subfamily C (CFTR/MRP) protein 1
VLVLLKDLAVISYFTAKHWQYADKIIVLGDNGNIAQQGTFETVSAAGEHIQRLNTYQDDGSPRDLNAGRGDAAQIPDRLEEEELDTTSRKSDLKTYPYFARAVGWPIMAIFIFSCAACVFGITFQGKYNSITM